VAFQPDGKALMSVSRGKKITVWDMAGKRIVSTLAGEDPSATARIYPDGRFILWQTSDLAIHLHEVASGTRIATFPGSKHGWNRMALTRDGKVLATVAETGGIELWDVASRQNTATIESAKFVALDPEGKVLAWTDVAGGLELSEVTTAKKITRLPGSAVGTWDPVLRSPDGKLLRSPDGKVIVWSNGNDTITLCEFATGKTIATISAPESNKYNTSALFSSDSKTCVILFDYRIEVWNVATGQKIDRVDGLNKVVPSITYSRPSAFSPDYRFFAAHSRDKTLHLWDLAEGSHRTFKAPISTEAPNKEASIAVLRRTFTKFSPDGKVLAWSDGSNIITLSESTTGKTIATISAEGGRWYMASFSPDGKTFVLQFGEEINLGKENNRQLELWNVASGEKICSVDGVNLFNPDMAFSPDGRFFAVGTRDKTLHLWDVADGSHRTFTAPISSEVTNNNSSVAAMWAFSRFSPDGKLLAYNDSSPDKKLHLWNLADGSHRDFKMPDLPEGAYKKLPKEAAIFANAINAKFSADSQSIMGETLGGSIIWDVTSGKEIASRKLGLNGQWEPSEDRSAELFDSFSPAAAVQSDTSRIPYEASDTSQKPYGALAVSPDRKTCAVGNYGSVNLQETATGSVIAVLHEDGSHVESALFSPDSRMLALNFHNFHDGASRIFNTTGAKLAATLPDKERVVAFTPDGCTVISQGASSIKLWDIWDLTVDQAKVR
jgi:WD40 repeat protein